VVLLAHLRAAAAWAPSTSPATRAGSPATCSGRSRWSRASRGSPSSLIAAVVGIDGPAPAASPGSSGTLRRVDALREVRWL